MKQEFFSFLWNSDVTHQLKGQSSSHKCVLEQREYTIGRLGNFCMLEQNQSRRIWVLQFSETLVAVLDPSISNEQHRPFFFRFDHNGVPIS